MSIRGRPVMTTRGSREPGSAEKLTRRGSNARRAMPTITVKIVQWQNLRTKNANERLEAPAGVGVRHIGRRQHISLPRNTTTDDSPILTLMFQRSRVLEPPNQQWFVQ